MKAINVLLHIVTVEGMAKGHNSFRNGIMVLLYYTTPQRRNKPKNVFLYECTVQIIYDAFQLIF
jgi:hypothetical protein